MATLAVSQIAKDDIDLARDLFSASQCGQAAVVRAQGSERGLHSLNCYPCGRLVLAIFEGHSGGPAAHLCREMIPRTLEKKRTKDKRSGNEHSEERERARLLDTFALAQTKVLATLRERKLKPHPGTTALVVILQPVDQVVEGQSRTKKLYVANAGDTHVFLYRNGKPIRLSSEHTAKDKTEKERVEAAGGWFDEDGFISGCLRLTRRLGGSGYPGVIATPDVRVMTIEPTDEVLIAGSLGFWKHCDKDAARILIGHEKDPEVAAKILVDHAQKKKATEDITCMVCFPHQISRAKSGDVEDVKATRTG